MPLRNVIVDVNTFFGTEGAATPVRDATFTVSLDKDGVVEGPTPRTIKASEMIDISVGSTGTVTVQLDDSNDIRPVDGSSVRPKYRCTLSAPGWAGVGFNGSNGKYLTRDITFAEWLLEGAVTPSPIPPQYGIPAAPMADDKWIKSDGGVWVVTDAPSGGSLPSGARGLYVSAATWRGSDRTVLLGLDSSLPGARSGFEFIYVILPSGIPWTDPASSIYMQINNNMLNRLGITNEDGTALTTNDITPGRLTGILFSSAFRTYRILGALDKRRQDFTIRATTTVSETLDDAAVAASAESMTNLIDVPAISENRYFWFGIPENVPDLMFLAIGATRLSNTITAFQDGGTHEVSPGETYKWLRSINLFSQFATGTWRVSIYNPPLP